MPKAIDTLRPTRLYWISYSMDNQAFGPRSTLVYLPSPEIGLDLEGTRMMAIHAEFASQEGLAALAYRGRVRRLFVLFKTG